MSRPTESYLRVPYDLRPAKQVERRMMFDALQLLSRAGFDIGTYQYTGFGSIFFVDFVLFHKYLGVRDLLNVEHDKKIQRRVFFNRPFELIRVEFKSAAEIIPTLSRDRRHILWLDYDDVLREWMFQDILSALNQLSVGSIFLVTVDTEPPVKDGKPKDWEAYFRREGGPYIPIDWKTQHFGREQLPSVARNLIKSAIASGLAYREEVSFEPLFSFLYADGHTMYTAGGVLVDGADSRRLKSIDFASARYLRQSLEADPYVIRVPNLTRKERIYLDARMPASAGWTPDEFELSQQDVDAYREIYRFYPNYAEVF